MRIKSGQRARSFVAKDIAGNTHSLQSLRGKPVLLSFFRDAACPFCNMRIFELTKIYPALRQRYGLTMLCFFQSSSDEISRHVGRNRRPFPLIADPRNIVYEQYGVEASVGGMAITMVRRMPLMFRAMFTHRLFPRKMGATMPADFLIGPDLEIMQAHYGRDVGDHFPVHTLIDSLEEMRGREMDMPAIIQPAF